MKKELTVDVLRTVSTKIGNLNGLYLTATATLNEQTKEVTAEVYIPWGTLPVDQVSDAIRLMQHGVEWATEQGEILSRNFKTEKGSRT